MQVRVFSNNEHVRALSGGDVWAIVGWSGDLLPLAARTPAVQIVCPASGTALWADLWAVPSQACHRSLGKGRDVCVLSLLSSAMHLPDLVCPASGTALWADVWAVPSQACHGSLGKGRLHAQLCCHHRQ